MFKNIKLHQTLFHLPSTDVIRRHLTVTRLVPDWSDIAGIQLSSTETYSSSPDSTRVTTIPTTTPRKKNGQKFYDFNGIHAKRKLTVHRACAKTRDGYGSTTKSANVDRNSLIDLRHHIVFCRVQKTGSTFLTGLLRSLILGPTKAATGRQTEELKTLFNLRQTGTVQESPDFSISSSFRFMFARDPYTRLLSGYVDKLFTVNTIYWKSVGAYIKNRKFKLHGELTQCGHDVTFPEFIEYVIDAENTGKHSDKHFTPIYKHCKPCQVEYDFIGKMETFKDDSMTLIKAWNRKYHANISFSDFEQETVLNRVTNHVGRLFKMKRLILKCTSFHSAMKRAWKDFQIRGFLSKNQRFPFSKKDVNSLTESQFLNVLKDILTDPSTDRKALKQQKMEALVQAYSLVPMEDLVKLRKVVRPDCQLFGYNESPSYIFDRTDESLQVDRDQYEYFNFDD
ncbi:carbohydrate sulfotransferase 8-like [Argopecten irradians]|uniref:carbohydrate sulfotransferase 8-like n=1 Tax=Argopecten irradians TaxID=31199 RepID=UPI003714A84D